VSAVLFDLESVTKARTRLDDLLIQAKLVSANVVCALEDQADRGGRRGDHLIAGGVISQPTLNAFLHRIPIEPADLKATYIEATDLMGLLLKLIYTSNLGTVRKFINAIKLPYQIVKDRVEMAIWSCLHF
jgi:hypothetical protein